MKRWPLIMSFVWVFLPGVAFSASYAPVADFSRVANNPQCRLTTMHEAFLKTWTPPAGFFMVPPYPNAVLTSAIPSGKAQVHGQTYQTLPSAVLLSSDPPDKIGEFYKGRLGEGWRLTEHRDILYLYRSPQPFASGEALFEQVMSKPGSLPYITVEGQVGACDQQLVSGARTRITIVSPPR